MSQQPYRITFLLYLSIIVLPLAFYFSITQLRGLEADTRAIRQVARAGGNILEYSIVDDAATKRILQQKIERTLNALKEWAVKADDEGRYYVGGRSPGADIAALSQCWEKVRQGAGTAEARMCWEEAKAITFATERMTALKTDRIYNTLYLSLAVAVLLLLLLIFFVRAYIEQQLRKHAILDGETGLYNHKFCHATLRKRCAQADRNGLPLSLLSLTVEGLEEGATRYTPAQREKLLEKIGAYLKGIVRESDVPCRDEDDSFLLILPDTPAEGAEVLAGRVREGLQREIGEESPDFSMKLKTRTKEKGVKCEEFLG